jgi:RNA polymerase sigma-54 factor
VKLSFGQEMRLAQKQMLAPRMIQSMEILQLPQQALEERLEQEIQNNETLELDEPERVTAEMEETVEVAASASDEQPLVVDQEHDNQADFERSYDWSAEYPDTDEERPRSSASQLSEASDRYLDAMANMAERPETLSDHLHEQIALYDLTDSQRAAVERVIYNLDANGYLQQPLEELVEPDGPEGQLAELVKALKVVQSMEPRGVGARTLRECLLLQIDGEAPGAVRLRRIVSDHLEDLAGNRLPLIARRTGYTIEEIEEVRHDLHRFQPKPGAIYATTVVPTVRPDVFVEQDENGCWKVRLDDVDMPNMRISPYYRQLLMSPATDAATRDYIKRKINSAQWLIEAIEQRRSTLLKTAQAIVDHQTRFLSEGPEAIEPLKMQQIADRIGMHVTTVSRAVDDKWLQTPRGLLPLRGFFVGGTVSSNGEEVAWDTVRLRLQEIIDEEPKDRPFSDDDLVVQLGKRGITLARRTVTKYRKAMKIPSSRQRRDWKLAKKGPSRKSSLARVASEPLGEEPPFGETDPAEMDRGGGAAG